MNFTYNDLVKYAELKSGNHYNIDDVIYNKELVYKIEELIKKDDRVREIVDKLQHSHFAIEEIEEIKKLYDKYFGNESLKSDEEIIAEKFGVNVENIECIRLENGEELYKFTGSNNKEFVLQKSEKNTSLKDELESVSDSVSFGENEDKNFEEASNYQRMNTYNEIDFYTKEDLNNRPDLLSNLSIDEIEIVRTLITNSNVKYINPKLGVGLGYDKKLIHGDFDKEEGRVIVHDSSDKILDDEEVLEPDIFDNTANLAQEEEYSKLVSTTELPIVDSSEYDQDINSMLDDTPKDIDSEEINNKKNTNKVYTLKDKNDNGYTGLVQLIILLLMTISLFGIIKLFIN